MFEYSKLNGVGVYPTLGLSFDSEPDRGFGNIAAEYVVAIGDSSTAIVNYENYGESGNYIKSPGSFVIGGKVHCHLFVGLRIEDSKPMAVLTFSMYNPQTPEISNIQNMRIIGMFSFDVEGLTVGGHYKVTGTTAGFLSSYAPVSWFPFKQVFISVEQSGVTYYVETVPDPNLIGPRPEYTEINATNVNWVALTIKSDSAEQEIISSPEVAAYIRDTTLGVVNPVLDSLDNLYVSA